MCLLITLSEMSYTDNVIYSVFTIFKVSFISQSKHIIQASGYAILDLISRIRLYY